MQDLIKAMVKKDGESVGEVELDNPAQNSFQGHFGIKEAGYYQITVYAYNPKTGNTGVDIVNYVVRD